MTSELDNSIISWNALPYHPLHWFVFSYPSVSFYPSDLNWRFHFRYKFNKHMNELTCFASDVLNQSSTEQQIFFYVSSTLMKIDNAVTTLCCGAVDLKWSKFNGLALFLHMLSQWNTFSESSFIILSDLILFRFSLILTQFRGTQRTHFSFVTLWFYCLSVKGIAV